MTNWQKQIQRLSVPDLLRVFPALGLNTAYAWKCGRRSPPDYSQPALLAWMKSQAAKVPAPKGSPIKRSRSAIPVS